MYSVSHKKRYRPVPVNAFKGYYIPDSGSMMNWFVRLPDSDNIICFFTHHHEAIEFLHIEQGELDVTLDGRSYHAVAGDTVIVNPFVPHEAFTRVSGSGVLYRCVLMELSFFIPSGECSMRTELLRVLNGESCFEPMVRDSARFSQLLLRLYADYKHYTNSPVGDGILLTDAYEILTCLLGEHYIAAPEETVVSRDLQFIRKVTKYTQDHYSEPISTATACAALSYNMNHFCRVFRTNFGNSYTRYLCEYRIQRAVNLYRGSDMSIGEIAAAVGFNDYGYFSRSFKKFIGVHPSAFFSGRGGKE